MLDTCASYSSFCRRVSKVQSAPSARRGTRALAAPPEKLKITTKPEHVHLCKVLDNKRQTCALCDSNLKTIKIEISADVRRAEHVR